MNIKPDDNTILLVSIKPQYAEKIFRGEKTIELRKSAPKKALKGSYMLIYVTAPVKELWGICKIKNIISDIPELLWENVGEKTGISKQEFNSYYAESNNAFGIELKEIKNLLDHSIKLDCLKSMIPGFTPPQTYRYIDQSILESPSLRELVF